MGEGPDFGRELGGERGGREEGRLYGCFKDRWEGGREDASSSHLQSASLLP